MLTGPGAEPITPELQTRWRAERLALRLQGQGGMCCRNRSGSVPLFPGSAGNALGRLFFDIVVYEWKGKRGLRAVFFAFDES